MRRRLRFVNRGGKGALIIYHRVDISMKIIVMRVDMPQWTVIFVEYYGLLVLHLLAPITEMKI